MRERVCARPRAACLPASTLTRLARTRRASARDPRHESLRAAGELMLIRIAPEVRDEIGRARRALRLKASTRRADIVEFEPAADHDFRLGAAARASLFAQRTRRRAELVRRQHGMPSVE